MSDGTVPPPPIPPTPEAATAPPPPPQPERGGTAHETEQTRTYPCAACGGDLEFDIPTQKLACRHCGNTQDLPDVGDRVVEERDFRAVIAQLRANEGEPQQLVEGEKEVVCQNCGGHTTFTGSLTSTRCPYCATPIQRDDVHDAPARLPVDGVLPFKVDDKQAKEVLEKWINSRWFAPNEFKTYSNTGSFASVYGAYFSYDAEAWTQYTGQRGDDYTVQVGSGDNRRTETRTRWSHAAGQVHNVFTDVTVLANTGLDRERVTKLEPWPTDQVRPFTPECIAGHLCRTYDNDVEQCFPEAEKRMESEVTSTIKRDIGGDKQRIHQKTTTYSRLTFNHLLLPIWLLTVIYDGKPFQVFINGVTGEVQGERPFSKVKIAIASVAAAILVIIGLVLYSMNR